MRATLLVLCSCSGGVMSHMPVAAEDIVDGTKLGPKTDYGAPVKTARQWTTALSPRNQGGFDFICQSYNNGYDLPTEWVVVNLEGSTAAVKLSPNQVNANSNYQIPSANTFITDNNQIRASNGRIFFPERYGNVGTDLTDQHYVNIAYFDPTTRQVTNLPSIPSPSLSTRHAIVYSSTFDQSGALIYFGTQAVIGDKPFVFKLDPATLAVTVIATVGVAASTNPKYAYSLAKDAGAGSQWLYIAVGQDPWELVKVDLTTGTQTVLLTTAGPGFQFIEFENRVGLGWSANTYSNGTQTRYWLADGAITAYPGSGAPTGGARTVTPYSNPLTQPPDVDWSRGIGEVRWRPYGSTGSFTSIPYSVSYKNRIVLESLSAMSNGVIAGNAEQYNGFFSKSAGSSSLTWFGAWPLGVSQPVILPVDKTLTYICGYPNGAFYRWDPTSSWLPGAATPNPQQLGSFFTASGVKYCYFLELGANARVYMGGRRERDSSGSALGYYVPIGATYAGVNSAPLDNYVPRGMAVMDGISRVVFSGETLDGSDAKLLVYSLDLGLLNQYTVQAGLKNTGLLFETKNPAVLCGVTNDAPYYAYRFNVQTGTLLQIVTLGALVGPVTQKPDGTLWALIGNNLKRIDPETLAVTLVSDLTASMPVTQLQWSGPTLYYVGADTNVLSSTLRSIPTGHLDPTP